MATRNFPSPEAAQGKKGDVASMFDAIAPRYDLLNRILSMGIDRGWRRRVIKSLLEVSPAKVLDVATGTGDLALSACRAGCDRVVGVDIAEEMLEVGRTKVKRAGLGERVTLQHGDAEALPFEDDEFDAATVAFGVRNFEDLDAGLREVRRVLKPGGRFIILEFSHPRAFPIKQLYGFYSRHVLPKVGTWLSGDSGAYSYLPESIAVFPDGGAFLGRLEAAGFAETRETRLTFGIASVYIGEVTAV